jgi:hypothetical protein
MLRATAFRKARRLRLLKYLSKRRRATNTKFYSQSTTLHYTPRRLGVVPTKKRKEHAVAPLHTKTNYILNPGTPLIFSENPYKVSPLHYSNLHLVIAFLASPTLMKLSQRSLRAGSTRAWFSSWVSRLVTLEDCLRHQGSGLPTTKPNNLHPHVSFKYAVSKRIVNFFATQRIRENIVPWYYHTLIRFIENCSGKRAMLQFYPFVHQSMDKSAAIRYRRWLPRLSFYERRLGHRFFLEEAIHIMHLSFVLRDASLLGSWLKAMILRISF